MVRTLIIDDEALARQRIRNLLDPYQDRIEIAGECRSGAEAVETIAGLRPDLIFLDIQMKDMTGFEVLEALPGEELPLVIFVTAYDQYAIRAFEVFAFDYLLKPFKEERFRQSLEKALENLQRPDAASERLQLRSIIARLGREKNAQASSIPIRLAGRICFLDPDDIRYIEAAGYYIELYTPHRKYLVRESLANIQERLDPGRFLRIHRSTIINRHFLQEINHLGSGDIEACMKDQRRFRISRSYRDELFTLLGI